MGAQHLGGNVEDGGGQTPSRPDLLHLHRMGLSVTNGVVPRAALSFYNGGMARLLSVTNRLGGGVPKGKDSVAITLLHE